MRRLVAGVVAGFALGVVATAGAGPEIRFDYAPAPQFSLGVPTQGWAVAPRYLHREENVVDTRACYVGTDGALHEMPTTWFTPL